MSTTIGGVLRVNGVEHRVNALASRRLSEVLRTDLGLTGTKVGCNAGDCGACTVLLDGRQVCSCLVAFGQADGRSISTVEGLAADPRMAGLQQAFVAAGATQCGICTPGMLMAAAELVALPRPVSRQQVLDGLGGVLCRCTGYVRIVDAVEAFLAGRASVAPLAAPDRAGGAGEVGSRLAKVDGWPRVTGEAVFGADGFPRDALWLRAIRSPLPHARFRLGDTDALLRSHPGIVRVLTAADVPGLNAYCIFPRLRDQPVFAEAHVRYLGEAVAAIVGTREAVEAFPVEAFPVEWEALPVVGIADALDASAATLHASRPGNVLMQGRQVDGDVAARKGSRHVSGSFDTSFVEHAYIEPEAGWARRDGDRITLGVPTQAPYMNRDEIASILGIEPTAVRVSPTAVGGGFGGKIDMSLQPLIAVAAWNIPGPIACIYSRGESMRVTTKRHPAAMQATLSCDESGRLATYEFHADFNTGPYSSCGPIVGSRVPIHAMGPYRVPAVHCTTRAIHTNDAIGGAFRGFGVPQCAIVHESLMDELAVAMGIDRFEFRLRNVLEDGDRTSTGQVLARSVGMRACLERLAPAWRDGLDRVERFNAAGGRLRLGIGIGCMWYGIGNTSQPNPSTIRIGIDAQARITLFSGAVDIGQGVSTILVQMCADALGVPAGDIHLVRAIGDTDLTLDAGKSSASRHTFISGNALLLAASSLQAALRALAGAGEAARVSFEGGRAWVEDAAGRRAIDLSGLPAGEDGVCLDATGTYNPPTTDLDARHQGVPYASYAFGAQVALVEVDTVLGTTRVLNIWAAHDVGRAINPTQVEGQIHGGIAQGLGLALMEEYLPGRTDNLHDYLVPTFGDMPEIEIHIVEAADPLGPFGAKGVGEPALIPTAPAILNAIAHATGVRPRHAPVTPSRLWQLLQEAGHPSTATRRDT
jgi:aldehyde oxidoreductase